MSRRQPRLLMLLHDYYPEEPRVAAEAHAALDAGFEVDVVALRRPGDAARADVEGVRCIRLPLEHRRGLGVRSTLVEYLRFAVMATVAAARLAARRRYDVVQVHTPPDFLIVGA